MDLLDELAELTVALESEGVEFALCGGLAMAVYAFPRATLDIDIMVEAESLERAKAVAWKRGFTVDVGLMQFRQGAIRIHRLTKIIPSTHEALVLDMLLVTPEIRRVWETRCRVQWERGELPVVSPEGLIALKSLRQSGQDQDDIQYLRGILDEN